MKKVLLTCLVAAIVLVSAGVAYERSSVHRVRAEVPPGGTLVRVGQQDLHLRCAGSGQPTVVIEAGAGSFSLDWRAVQRNIAEDMRVCTYDRPGMGWSPAAPAGASTYPSQLLHRLLRTSGETGPYLLVGHSLGGLYVQTLARTHPEEVAGVVLVDSVHAAQNERLPAALLQVQDGMLRQMRVLAVLAHVGVPRLAVQLGLVPVDDLSSMEPSDREPRIALAVSAAYLGSVVREARGVEGALREAREMDAPFPDVPLAVVSRGLPEPGPGLSTADAAATEQAWRALQDDLTSLAPAGKQWIATESGHNIMLDQPELIVAAVRHVAETWSLERPQASARLP